MNSNAKFRGLARRGFPATKKKIKNPGVDLRPPSVRGLKLLLVGGGRIVPTVAFLICTKTVCARAMKLGDFS